MIADHGPYIDDADRLTNQLISFWLCSPLTVPYRQEAIDLQNDKIQQHLLDLYAKEPDFDQWLDCTEEFLRELPGKKRDCNLDLYAYARSIVEYHRYVQRQKKKRQSRKILQSQWQSPFISTRLRADPTRDRGAILRASNLPERPTDQQAFLELFNKQSREGEQLRRLEEESYNQLRNHRSWKHVDAAKAKSLAEGFELRATADGYQRAALQAVLRKHIHNEEQYYVGSWENNIVRLPQKPWSHPEAKIDEKKRGYYTWTNKYFHFNNRRLEGAEKSKALRELVRPLHRNEPVQTDDIAVALIGEQILKENINPDPSSAKLTPASQVWGFPLPDELKPVQLENYFGPEKTVSTKGRKRKATAAHGPRSKRPRHDSFSSEDGSEPKIPLGFGKIMPPEIRDFWTEKYDEKEAEKAKYYGEESETIDGLPFYYLAETNYLAHIKAKHLKGVQRELEREDGLPDNRSKRKLPYWANVTGRDKTLPSEFLPLPGDPHDINDWDFNVVSSTGPTSGESSPNPCFSLSSQV